ncbi:MAG: hypothetical protein F6K62_22850 [Sphaerospermopsis sp. SIO1G2]|nr:hypothetical protein [Sphaerospermopsis sp. SIO1G1]NET73674.1 hypothetical protein [Sphaerospermopsis sp. SIO1G2]
MQPKTTPLWLIQPDKPPLLQVIAGGVILPDQQVAIARSFPNASHGTFLSFPSFQTLQAKRGRKIIFADSSLNGYEINTFQLVRKKDVTGISGTGIVAVGCYFKSFGGLAVMQWLTEFTSTAWYIGGLEQIEFIHGHKGNTQIILDV